MIHRFLDPTRQYRLALRGVRAVIESNAHDLGRRGGREQARRLARVALAGRDSTRPWRRAHAHEVIAFEAAVALAAVHSIPGDVCDRRDHELVGDAPRRKKRGGSPSHSVREPLNTLSDGTSASLPTGIGGRCTGRTGNLAPLPRSFQVLRGMVKIKPSKTRNVFREKIRLREPIPRSRPPGIDPASNH